MDQAQLENLAVGNRELANGLSYLRGMAQSEEGVDNTVTIERLTTQINSLNQVADFLDKVVAAMKAAEDTTTTEGESSE